MIRAERFRVASSAVSSDLPDHAAYRDFTLGIEKMREHVDKNLPELHAGGLSVLDIGPGVGLFPVLAEDLGNVCVGVDAKLGCPTIRAYARITGDLGLDVRYVDFRPYLDGGYVWDFGLVDVVHARGSLDAIFSAYRIGNRIAEKTDAFLSLLAGKMPCGGIVWIGHNFDPVSNALVLAIRSRHTGFDLVRDEAYVTKLVRK